MSDLILLRHGETTGQSSIRFYGLTDIPLSDFGIIQMERTGNFLQDYRFNTVIASPLQRSINSALIVLNGRSHDITIVNDFREINFGEWEGLTKEEIFARNPASYHKWHERGSFEEFPGGDDRNVFFNRVKRAALNVFASSEPPTLAVLHKGVIRAILSALLNITVEELMPHPIELGSIHRLENTAYGWKLTGRNETEHLGEYRKENS